MAFFHVYMTTSVSAYDIIQNKLNDYSSRISFVTFSHHVDGRNSEEIRYILSSLNFPTAKLLCGHDLKKIYEASLKF